ncbi:MAG: FAD binding domain-containing protein [Burkholderiales bacterium]
MKPAPFDYVRPATLDEALRLLAQHRDNAKVIAGGQSLVPMMNMRFARPELLIDINALKPLDYHHRDGDVLAIGALARHATLAGSEVVRALCPLVSEAYCHVAHGTIRNRGTLAGNLCHADPASEMPAVMLALDAVFVLKSQQGERRVKAAEFFQSPYTTATAADELLAEVRVPISTAGHAFEEISARQGDFAMTLVASTLKLRDQRIDAAAVAYAGVSGCALRLPVLEQMLIGQTPSPALFERVGAAAAEAIDVMSDQHVDAAYRRDLIRTLTPRALARAAAAAAVVA